VLDAGAVDFLHKPFEMYGQRLIDCLHAALERRKGRRRGFFGSWHFLNANRYPLRLNMLQRVVCSAPPIGKDNPMHDRE
jgi:DNA-binding response OmpR family regulator